MKTKILIKKLSALIVKPSDFDNLTIASTFNAGMLKYGFSMSRELFNVVASLPEKDIKVLYDSVMPVLQELKGADVSYKAFYPNFPSQVMEAHEIEQFVNAINHYWSGGLWKPEYAELSRKLSLEMNKIKVIGLTTEMEFKKVFTSILASNESISSEDKSIVEWFILEESNLEYPEEIPFKENMCIVAGMFLDLDMKIDGLVKTATDILRVLTYISGGDVSLASNTKFKTLPRKDRRKLVKLIEKKASEEDVHRHRNKWVRAFHSLHVGDYSDKVYALAKKFRNNEKVETYNGLVQYAFEEKDLNSLIELLSQRPGEFARKLDHLLRTFAQDQRVIVEAFLKVADKVATRVLLQVLGHFYTRASGVEEKIVFPKGLVQCAKIVKVDHRAFALELVSKLCKGIKDVLRKKFADEKSLDRVWIDPELRFCPVPSQQRSASESAFTVARGTRLNIGGESKNTLRFFIYWVGKDIDLSASLHDEDFKLIEHISYTNLRSAKYNACHSGDIVDAPNGASEFIDITMDQALEIGARYVAMNVLVYNGPTFAEHEKCYVGWMLREKPQSNEIYDAATVSQKIDLTAQSRNMVPAVFDLKERKVIYCDLSTSSRMHMGGNNVESNKASIEQTMKAIVKSENKVNLYQLFKLHAEARGQIVINKDDADTVFSLDEGITPYDLNVITSEYIK